MNTAGTNLDPTGISATQTQGFLGAPSAAATTLASTEVGQASNGLQFLSMILIFAAALLGMSFGLKKRQERIINEENNLNEYLLLKD